MRWTRHVLLALVVGCGAAAWWLTPQEVMRSNIPLALFLFAVIGIVIGWLRLRFSDERQLGTMPFLALTCLALASWPLHVALILREHGYQSRALPLQVLALVALAGLIAVDYRLARREDLPRWLRTPLWAVLPVALLGSGAWAMHVALNPITVSDEAPSGKVRAEITAGDVTVTAHLDSVSGRGPNGVWTYTHTGTLVSQFPNPKNPETLLIPSPDGTHVAAAFVLPHEEIPKKEAGSSERLNSREDSVLQHVVVFESATGRVVAEVSTTPFINVQLTNSAALLGQEVFSLHDGSRLWSDSSIPLTLESRTATENLFIIDAHCLLEADWIQGCQLKLMSAERQESATTVDGVMYDMVKTRGGEVRDVRIVDGWVLRRSGPIVPITRSDDESQDEAHEKQVGTELVAYNLDSRESIPVGRASGLDSQVENGLGIRPEYTTSERYRNNTKPPEADSWFNPKTRQVER